LQDIYIIWLSGNIEDKEHEIIERKVDNYVIATIITILNVIYLLFSIIQFSYLFTQIGVKANFDYATYARSGFFELVFVSVINLILILVSTTNRQKGTKEVEIYKKVMNVMLCVFNIIILISSWYRMYLYESTYGYTTLRLLVYIGIFTEAILLMITMLYIFKEKINILKYYFIVIVSVYVIINYMNMDNMIAKRNVDRYLFEGDIDYTYLIWDLSYDAIPQIIRLIENTRDSKMREYLIKYLQDCYYSRETHYSSWQEFNISRIHAEKLIKEMDIL